MAFTPFVGSDDFSIANFNKAFNQLNDSKVDFTEAQSLTANQMAQARGNIGAAKSTVIGTITRNKIYKIGTYAKGSGDSSVGTVCIRIWNASDYANKNYILVFSSAIGNLAEFHGVFNYNYLCSISVYTDPNTTDSSKMYTIFASTQNYVDLASVSIENEHNFTTDFIDVTDTFPTITSGLEKVWESIYEWENPPLQLGVEYRTTERYLGKPVYVKVVDCGLIADNKEVAHGISNMMECMSFKGVRSGLPMPQIFNHSLNDPWTCYVADVNKTNITLACGSSSAGSNCQVTLKYTKTTD